MAGQRMQLKSIRYFANSPFARFRSACSGLLAFGRDRGDRDEKNAAALGGLGPGGQSVDRHRKRRCRADGESAVTGCHFQPVERAVDLLRRRHCVKHNVSADEGQVSGAGNPAGGTARIGPVVDIDQAALGGLDRKSTRLNSSHRR